MRPPEPKTRLTLPCPWQRLRFNLECIGWTQNELARRVRLDDSAVRRMCRGAREIPDDIAMWLEQLAGIHRAMWDPTPVWEPTGKSAENGIVPQYDPDDPEVAINRELLTADEIGPETPALSGKAHLAFRGDPAAPKPPPADVAPARQRLANEQRLRNET